MKYLLRLLFFLVQKVLLFAIIAGVLTFGFMQGMNLTNIRILVGDGLDMRAGAAFGLKEMSELIKFFTRDYLESDALLRDMPYRDYTIRGYDMRLEVDSITTFPWQDRAEAVVTERIVAIDGELPVAKQTEEQRKIKEKILPPKWPDAVYQLSLVRTDGRWRIASVQRVADAPVTSPPYTPLPTPTASVIP